MDRFGLWNFGSESAKGFNRAFAQLIFDKIGKDERDPLLKL
jgi:hypothetical protein